MTVHLPEGYHLRAGTVGDRGLLRQFLRALFDEQRPDSDHDEQIDGTLNRLFDVRQAPTWWVMRRDETVGCLWLGRAWDQMSGSQTTYVHLLYIVPEHRRRGLGRFLLGWATDIARDRGDGQLTLQVLPDNRAALSLYAQMDFQTRALFLGKSL